MERLLSLANSHVPSLYDLKLEISPVKPNFQGHLAIDCEKNANYVATEEGCFFTLHASSIVITSAVFSSDLLASEKVKAEYNRASETVSFKIPASFEHLDVFKVDLVYMGKIHQIKTYKDVTKGIFKTNYLDSVSGKASNYIFATHSQPSFARLIFPSIDELSSKVPIKLTITTNLEYTCAANMPLLETEFTNDDRKVFNFKESPPLSPSTFGFVLGHLEFMESEIVLQEGKTIPLRFYTPIGEISNANYGLSMASQILPHMEKLIKYPFPLEKLDYVALPFLSDGAMENWGLITVKQDQILIPKYMENDKNFTQQVRQVIAHELVHQWVGNLVTFESWDHLWLNESFATFLAFCCLEELNLDPKDLGVWSQQSNALSETKQIDSVEESSIILNRPIGKRVQYTHDAFEKNAYYKGIFLLKQLGNVLENNGTENKFTVLLKGVSIFLAEYKFKSAKPAALWKILHSLSPNDILGFMFSWTSLPGLPVLNVSISESNDRILVEQHRYLDFLTPKELNLEDNPYFIPLNIRLGDGSLLPLILNDRRVELEIDPKNFVIANSNATGYYRTHYTLDILKRISENIKVNKINESELVLLLEDMSLQLTQKYFIEDDLIGFMTIFNAMASTTWNISWSTLFTALNQIQIISNSLFSFTNVETFHKFESSWLSPTVENIFNKIDWSLDFDVTNYDVLEMKTRDVLLILGKDNKNCQSIAKKLFKFITQGPKKSLPKELLPSTFIITAHISSQKEYKQILALVKNADIETNNTNATSSEIQTAALASLGYAQKVDLITKTLNFVMTNIDSKLIELAILGIKYNQSHRSRNMLWDWFSLHYDNWTLKSTREGSDYALQLSNTMFNLTKIVFSTMNGPEERKLKESFISEKMIKFPKIKMEKLIKSLEVEDRDQNQIASHSKSLLAWI